MSLLSVLRYRRPRIPVVIPRHSHYCDECDQEWAHEVEMCLQHWVWRCPRCLPSGGGRTPVPPPADPEPSG